MLDLSYFGLRNSRVRRSREQKNTRTDNLTVQCSKHHSKAEASERCSIDMKKSSCGVLETCFLLSFLCGL